MNLWKKYFKNKEDLLQLLEQAEKITDVKLFFIQQFQLGTFKNINPKKNYIQLFDIDGNIIPEIDIKLSNKLERLKIEPNDRIVYDILKYYYSPLNQAMDNLLLNYDTQQNFQTIILAIKNNDSYDPIVKKEIIKQLNAAFKNIEQQVKFSSIKKIDNLYNLVNFLDEHGSYIEPIKSFEYGYDEKIDEELDQDENLLLFVKEVNVALNLNIMLSNLFIKDFKVGLDKELDIETESHIISNRLSLLLKEINSKKELFADKKNGMAILKKCLNSILYTEDSILKLELLGDDFLYNANGIIEENPNLRLEEYFIEFNKLHGDFKNIFEIYSQGIQKLLEFNLLNSGIKLSSKIDLKKQNFTELDLGKLYSALNDNTYNVSELLFEPDMKINRDFLFVLKENKTLKLVSFEDCIIQDIVGLTDVIRKNIIIKSLNFARSKLTSEHIIEIANALEQNLTLKELNLSGNMDEVEEVTNECIVSLANVLKSNETLLSLDISHMPYSDKGVIAIAGALKLNSTLKKINLSHTYSITDEGVEAIAEALEYNNTLEEIDLQESSITDEGVIVIAEALKLNSTLKKINLSANTGITDKGVIAIAEALKLNSTLKEINLANSTITEHGMATFIECLEFNSSLQEVSFMSRNIGFESFVQMVNALKINESLKSVCLFVNDNGDTAAYEIAELLSTNSKLQKLNLYLRDVTDEGVIVIAEALKLNSTLKEMNLSNCQFTDEGAIAFSEALKANKALEILDLSGSQFTDVGAIAIADALKLNSTLKEINLSRNNIGNDGVATIVDALKLNGNLKKVLLENNNVTDENAIINLFKENDVLVTCGIPIVENNAILIDIMNRKYESVKQEIDTIKFYGVSNEDLINRYTKLVQLKSFKDLLHESENTLDSYREKLLESIFFFKPNLIDRCELLHKLFIIEKDNIKYIQDDSMLKLLDQGMHGDFDKIVFTLLDYQLAGEEENIYSMLPNYESIDKLLKILQCEDISLKSAVDKYTAISALENIYAIDSLYNNRYSSKLSSEINAYLNKRSNELETIAASIISNTMSKSYRREWRGFCSN